MNTAITLDVVSRNKNYTVKLFSKGKVVITGVPTAYQQSEISQIITLLFKEIFAIANIPYSAPTLIKTTLSNFTTRIPLALGALIDINHAIQSIQRNRP